MIADNTPKGGRVRLLLFACQRAGMALGSLHGSFRPAPAMQRILWVCCRPIRGAAIRVDRVPIAYSAAGIDVESVVAVATIRRAQPHIAAQ